MTLLCGTLKPTGNQTSDEYRVSNKRIIYPPHIPCEVVTP